MSEKKTIPKLEEYYVAYFDILGYKELLEKCENKQEFLNQIYSSIQSIVENIKDGNNFIKFETLEQETKINYQLFSDNICIYLKYTKNYIALDTFIVMIQKLQLELICDYGIFIRGGISKGLFAADKNFIFGPALVEAVKFEYEAKYPRFLVSKDVILDYKGLNYLQFIKWNSFLDSFLQEYKLNKLDYSRFKYYTNQTFRLHKNIIFEKDIDDFKKLNESFENCKNNHHNLKNTSFVEEHYSLMRKIVSSSVDNAKYYTENYSSFIEYNTLERKAFLNYFILGKQREDITENLEKFLPQIKELYKDYPALLKDYTDIIINANNAKKYIALSFFEHKHKIEINLDKYKDNPKVFEKYMWAMLFHNDICEKYNMKEYMISNDHLKSMI